MSDSVGLDEEGPLRSGAATRTFAILLVASVTALPCRELRGQQGLPPAPEQSRDIQARGDPLVPDTILAPPGQPTIVYLDAPGSDVVALRLSLEVDEAPSEAGAGRLLQLLAVERAQGRAVPAGALVSGSRTPTSVVYTIAGSVEDMNYLAFLLREATRPPRDEIAFQRAKARMLAGIRRREETASGRVAAELQERLAPTTPPLVGTTGALEALTLSDLRNLWARTHAPDGMTLIVAGDVPRELLLLASLDLGTTRQTGTVPTSSSPVVPRNPTQVIRHWFGEAHVLQGLDDPHGEVAALLLAEHFRSSQGDFEVTVQLWEVDHRKALAMIGAAYPRSQRAMMTTIEGGIAGTSEELDEESLRNAVATVRKRILFSARTPAGRVAMVGRHFDATRDPRSARIYVDALERLSLGSMRRFLTSLASSTPVRAEIRP